jgi:ATPase
MEEVYVPDTSVIVDGRFTEFLKGRVPAKVIIPEALISEIEHQANEGRSIGFAGLEEMKRLRKMSDSGDIYLDFTGRRPNEWQVKRAKSGEIDNLIRQSAYENSSTLVTGDLIQKSIAEIKGIKVLYLEPLKIQSKKIETFFSEDTMSVHLKEGTRARLKIGKPGKWGLEYGSYILNREELTVIANDIVERVRNNENSFLDVDVRGATVAQLDNMRIVITRPPVSDGIEITAVRPIRKLSLEDYKISTSLMKRFEESAEGIIVSGKPGAGKSTFVQALAEYYNGLGKIVKTIEKPRDLQISKEITQLTPIEGSIERTGDILLLERPDYTVFDEIRVTSDFVTYSDLRLAGVGMLGVIHASRAIDALQRFVGKIELGLIPQIIDTIIFIENGQIADVLDLSYSVKIPAGMSEEDLARPVIEIKDFFTGNLLYEIYTFGEQVVVVPVKRKQKRDLRWILDFLQKELPDIPHEVDFDSSGRLKIYVPSQFISGVIGGGGNRVRTMEKNIGLPIDIEEMNSIAYTGKATAEVKNNKINISVGQKFRDREVEILVDNSPIFSARVSKNGIIQVKLDSTQGRALRKAIAEGKQITYSSV